MPAQGHEKNAPINMYACVHIYIYTFACACTYGGFQRCTPWLTSSGYCSSAARLAPILVHASPLSKDLKMSSRLVKHPDSDAGAHCDPTGHYRGTAAGFPCKQEYQ